MTELGTGRSGLPGGPRRGPGGVRPPGGHRPEGPAKPPAKAPARAAAKAAPRGGATSSVRFPAAESQPRQAKGAQTRRSILDAAIARFGREGYRATAVADIARDAGVGGTVAYTYFPSKEALFLAALDEDAAAVIEEGLSLLAGDPLSRRAAAEGWRQSLVFTLLSAVDRHPLARRLLAGLEPDVTERVLEIPALAQMRKACAERIREEQIAGSVRSDIDPVTIGNGIVSIVLSLLMSVVQVGTNVAAAYGHDVAAVLEAALEVPASKRDDPSGLLD